jgi:DNA-binding beta-propeller fold protein YncE
MNIATFARVTMLVLAAGIGTARAVDPVPLTVEARIPLGNVSGRIDHLAFDPSRGRLYVAELGNDSVGVVEVKTGRLLQTVRGLDEPQGIGYESGTDTIYVANGGDGTVRLFSGADFKPLGVIPLGADADNVRVDPTAHRVYVGYGEGAIAVIDPMTRKRIADIPLRGHPESFQLEPDGRRIFVNVPDAGHVAIVSRDPKSTTGDWPNGSLRANYPMALDAAKKRVIIVFRQPARLRAYDWTSGRASVDSEVCSDADDVFVDARRHRLYVLCGEGFVDTLDEVSEKYAHAGRLTTSSGSRTGLLVPELDRLYIAIRATRDEPAAIWVVRPGPLP